MPQWRLSTHHTPPPLPSDFGSRNATAPLRILSGAVEIWVSAGSAPDTSGVVNDLLCEQRGIQIDELVVIDQ